ncbi:MAG: hypothetical protein KC731_00180, partial [Myxococcales bacterium]|nr:hypothetical protein [Myxococcales bacterium]
MQRDDNNGSRGGAAAPPDRPDALTKGWPGSGGGGARPGGREGQRVPGPGLVQPGSQTADEQRLEAQRQGAPGGESRSPDA